MTKAERAKIYDDAWFAYGPEKQLVVAIEEMSELQKEICKKLRTGRMDLSRELVEEIADVQIMLEQIILFYDVGQEVDAFVESKVSRLERRLDAERDDTE